MRIFYSTVIIGIFAWLSAIKSGSTYHGFDVVDCIVRETGVPNSVSGILLRNRLYDTIFEVIVFTVAVLGVQQYLSREKAAKAALYISDDTIVLLARIGAMIAALICLELSIRGHLSPGGGFAAGVSGGSAIALVAITSRPEKLAQRHKRWHAAGWEKVSVLMFLALSCVYLSGYNLPLGTYGALLSGGFIPWLNFLIAAKVAIGSWTIIVLFIRYRGLL